MIWLLSCVIIFGLLFGRTGVVGALIGFSIGRILAHFF